MHNLGHFNVRLLFGWYELSGTLFHFYISCSFIKQFKTPLPHFHNSLPSVPMQHSKVTFRSPIWYTLTTPALLLLLPLVCQLPMTIDNHLYKPTSSFSPIQYSRSWLWWCLCWRLAVVLLLIRHYFLWAHLPSPIHAWEVVAHTVPPLFRAGQLPSWPLQEVHKIL